MRIRTYLAAIVALAFCGTLGRAVAADGASQEQGDLIARIHFVGMAKITADPNATALNEIRAMPESGKLREEIIQKLTTTPFRVMNKNSPPRKNDHADLLRPLVEDIIKSETYLEMRGTTNAGPEVMLAVKLDEAQAKIWRNNLAATLKDWTGIAIKDIEVDGFKGWELKKHHSPNVFRFIHAGDWVVFGWGEDELRLQPGILQKIKAQKRPVAEADKYWLEAWLDGPKLMANQPLPFKLARMQLNLEGRKDYLRPELKMQFAEPLGLKLEPWQMPTNIIFNPVTSITFIRGFGPLLSKIPAIANLNANPLPNQAIVWALPDIPFETCVVMPVKNASNYLARISPGLISLINTNLEALKLPGKALLTTNKDIAIRGIPILAPFLKATNDTTGDYLLGGIFAVAPPVDPFPWDSVSGTITPSNVVYYGWESNGERRSQWMPMSQIYFMRTDSDLPRIDTPAEKWVLAIKSRLKNCGTVVTLTRPNELTLVRNAPIGLTGFEMNLMALWIDGPEFPIEPSVNYTGSNDPQGVSPSLSPK